MGKRNKKLCELCIYHGYLGHNGPNQETISLRSQFTYESCIGRDGKDKRGDDPDKCLLMVKGEQLQVKPKTPDWSNWGRDKYNPRKWKEK